MAIRRRTVLPDDTLWTDTYGEIPVVSDQGWVEAVVAAAQAQALYGGVMTTVVDRHPTDLPQEMVTTRGIIELKDRTDARAQPEPQTGATYSPPPVEPITAKADVESVENLQREMDTLREMHPPEEAGEAEAAAAHADDVLPVEGEDTSALEPAR